MSAERTAPPTVEEVTDVLSTVIDPELGSDVVSLGMIPRTEISPDGAVVVEVRLTISGCPMRAEIKKICLLYTSPSPRDVEESRMPSSA